MESTHLDSLLKRHKDKDFVLCTYEELGMFLDGLILLKRGSNSKAPNTSKPNSDTIELNNNLILKKLRIALELREPETEIIFSLGDTNLSKQQLSALFRNQSHKNFKPCSNELLMKFLEGLDEFYFVDESSS